MNKKTSFHPERSWQALDDRIAKENDQERRSLLEQVRNHVRVEIGGDLEALMNTLDGNPVYHFWGFMGNGEALRGRDEVEAFYQEMIDGGGNRFELDIQRIVVDAGAVVTEGPMWMPMPGATLLAAGISEANGEPVDSDANYLAETQVLTVWPAGDDGRLKGEDIYMATQPLAKLHKLDD